MPGLVNAIDLDSNLIQAVVAGGDFGGMVAYVLGALHFEHCAAVHSNITICLPSFANPWTMLQASLQPPVMAIIAPILHEGLLLPV